MEYKDNKQFYDVMDTLSKNNPKLAKHFQLRNDVIMKFASHIEGGVNILTQPMCEHCEKPAAWNENGTAHCFACGKDTKNPITVYDYFLNYTKNLSEEDLMILKLL
jgi:hypothetical protein